MTKSTINYPKMKTMKMLLLVMLLLNATASFAQTWNEMARWVEDRGKYKLAELAHPYDYANDKVISYSVESGYSSIVVRVKYQGFMGAYTDRYEIIKGNYNGQPYFRRIRVDEPYDPFFSAFEAIDSFGIGYENAYLRIGASHLYNGENYNNLSKGEKVAFILFAFFLDDYYDD